MPAPVSDTLAGPVATDLPAKKPKGLPLVGIIMGSRSDWETMRHASETLTALGISHECRVVSAHRTPDLLFDYAKSAHGRGLEIIIAGAGGAAHLPGMCASQTHLPVLGVPVQSAALSGWDSLLSIVQMPAGVPVGTLAIGRAGAINAALLATSALCGKYPQHLPALMAYRQRQTERVLADADPRLPAPDEPASTTPSTDAATDPAGIASPVNTLYGGMHR